MDGKGLAALGLRPGDRIEARCGGFVHEGVFVRYNTLREARLLVMHARWQQEGEVWIATDQAPISIHRRLLPYPPPWIQPLRRWWESGCRLSWTLGHSGGHATVSVFLDRHHRDDGDTNWSGVIRLRGERYVYQLGWWGPVVVYKMTPIRDEQGRALPWEPEAPHV